MRSRLYALTAVAVVLLICICGQQAMAQSPHHLSIRVVPSQTFHAMFPQVVLKPNLYQLSSGFGVLPPLDVNGGDQWPCFGGQADCSTISAGGVVIGTPAYTQSLSACNANVSGAPNCGQIFWFYEDDTNDNTDHLIVSLTAKQGLNFILNTGLFDFGPNPFAPGSVIIIFDDTAFGTLGQTGPGNGFCAGSNVTCVNPHAGAVNLTATTNVGLHTITTKFKIFLK